MIKKPKISFKLVDVTYMTEGDIFVSYNNQKLFRVTKLMKSCLHKHFMGLVLKNVVTNEYVYSYFHEYRGYSSYWKEDILVFEPDAKRYMLVLK